MKKIFTTVLLTVLTVFLFAQGVANYGVTRNTGVTFTSISGTGNNFGATWRNGINTDDNLSAATPIGFTFTYLGIPYTQFSISTNGYLTFNTGTTATGAGLGAYGYQNTNFSTTAGTVSALAVFYDDQQTAGNLGTQLDLDNSYKYLVTGAPGSRVLTVEWVNVQDFSTTSTSSFNYQIMLYEADNHIEYNYGTMTLANSVTISTMSYTLGINNATISAVPTVSELLTQQTVNTATFNNTASNALGGNVPANMPTTATQIVFTLLPACTTPADQPSALNLTPTPGSISGTFTAAASAPSNYLVIRTATATPPTTPVDGTNYTPGTNALGGFIVSNGTTTNFNATGLTPLTTYYFWIYSFNSTGCSGGPLYQTVSPLAGSSSTIACGGLLGTYSVGPTGTYASLTAALTAAQSGLSGPVIFELQSTYLSSVETFPLVISPNVCVNAGQTITIRPELGATALSITSANATGTINYDGGDYVSFDGRPGGVGAVSQLTISNTVTTGYAIQFINNAVFNNIIYCTVSGVNNSTTSGVIFFNNAVGLTAGNSNNTIDNCDIRDGATTPTNLIYNSGNTSDLASGNNNNNVTNSLLHDWFNATSTTASAAINIFNGASAWTITGNSFYQSATRTFTMTTATDQGAIHVNSPAFGSNFTISNNFIGGTAPLCGGTAWTYTGGATGTPTPRLIRFNSALGATSNITNNTIQNIAITSSSTSTAHSLISQINGNVNIANNTIGSQTAVGNITFTLASTSTAPFFLPIGTGTGGTLSTINITNNNIGGITVSSSSTGAVSFRVIYAQPVAGSTLTITGNTIGGTIANSIRQQTGTATATVGSLFGILVLNPSVGNVITNNTVRNLSVVLGTPVAGPSLTGINVQSSGGGHTITGNSIFNLTTNSLNVAINNAASVVGLTMTGSAVGGTNVSSNTIYNLTNTNATVAGWISGMYFGTSPSFPQTIIAKNNVHSINLASAINGAGMAGIFLPNAGFAQVNNNMVRLGIDASGASITNALQIHGIWKASSATMSIYHNTVYIGGTGVVSATTNTFAFRRSTSGATQDTLMNNIFYNARSNASGTGKHYAINTNAATLLYSNYNDLLANGTGGVLGINVATDYATLPLWNVATNQDWNSISADPVLVNPTGTSATVDLHVNTGLPTPVEQAGYNLPIVTDDFDSQVRSGLTPVDIGADAANFIVSDIAPPVIYLTPLLINTCGTGDRLVTNITITDATGVPTTGALVPRIYYRKNAGAYFSQPGTLTSGTGTNGTWDFTIVAADMGGLVATDVVSYYIIAQDIVGTPNIASNFGGAIATDVNTIITQPTTPNTYTISGTTLSGSYNVGGGQTYTTLTAAVAAYNSACLTGPVTFLLTDASYSAGETFPIVINANPYSSSINTLTIKPTLVNTTITGSTITSILNINGGDHVIIDGSINNTANTVCPLSTATRDLTISQTNASTAAGVVWLSTTAAFDAVTNSVVKNCIVIGQGNATTVVGIGSGGTVVGSGGTNNNNLSFINNDIRSCRVGIYSSGAGPANKNQNLTISQNVMTTAAPGNIGETGIYSAYSNNILVTGNVISNIIRTGSPDGVGINMGFGAVSGFSTTLIGIVDGVSNVVISNNTIGAIENSGTFSSVGIAIGNTVSGTSLIANNMIYGVKANCTSPDIAGGIVLGGGTGQVNVYYNTVSMQGTITGATAASSTSACLAVTSPTTSPIDIKNNIFSNTQLGNAGATLRLTAIALGYPSYIGLISNHNDLFAAGAGPGNYTVGITGGIATGTSRISLANFQLETGTDANSISVLPNFFSATDLHLNATNNCALDGKGTPIGSITTDFDCVTRDVLLPDIGADEFNGTPSNVLYNTVGTTVTDTRNVTGLEVFRAPNCERFAALLPSGGSPVSGSVTARVYKYATVQFYNAEPYLQRVIDITPATGAGTATGTVTLYYTQQEFDDFNTANAAWPDLPTGPADAPGIANLRITKYNGTPTITPSSPNQYSAGTYQYINPPDVNIVWNAADSRWEVTVDITGFSGFYIHTNSQFALPIVFNYLNGVRQGSKHLLDWKVTCTSSPTATLILERSGDNKTFTAINTVNATALRCADPFFHTDANPLLGINYYRVKIIDASGKVSYGNTIALLNAVKGFEVLNTAPNPVTVNGLFKLNITGAKAEQLQTIITDMQGRIVGRKQINIVSGFNTIPMEISQLASGNYHLQVISSSGDKSKLIRIVKQ